MFIHKYKFLSLVPLGAADDQSLIIHNFVTVLINLVISLCYTRNVDE